MSDEPLPPFYDDLDATREHALALITRGVKDRRSGMHTFNVATIGLDGAPRIRTVVNRGFDAATRSVRFHTDVRAPKIKELENNPSVAIHLYDAKAKIQLRLSALAAVHHDTEVRADAWTATRDFSRACYRVLISPGDVTEDPATIPFLPDDNSENGAENFVAVTAKITSLEWLYLAHQGHRRAKFSWNENEVCEQAWLVP